MSMTAPAVVRIASRPVAVPPVVPVDHDLVTVQSLETADNIVWGTRAEDDLGPWIRSCEDDRTGSYSLKPARL
jgi:hypothetical protein